MKIAIGGDHAGYELKESIKEFLSDHEIADFGPMSADSVDYPDFVHPLATAVDSKEQELGILICGSANGVCMTANKHTGIRAAIAWLPELAELARQHNNANILCLPARFLTNTEAEQIVAAFLNASFEGGRHERRVNKIAIQDEV